VSGFPILSSSDDLKAATCNVVRPVHSATSNVIHVIHSTISNVVCIVHSAIGHVIDIVHPVSLIVKIGNIIIGQYTWCSCSGDFDNTGISPPSQILTKDTIDMALTNLPLPRVLRSRWIVPGVTISCTPAQVTKQPTKSTATKSTFLLRETTGQLPLILQDASKHVSINLRGPVGVHRGRRAASPSSTATSSRQATF
jgi:hypothetical protein